MIAYKLTKYNVFSKGKVILEGLINVSSGLYKIDLAYLAKINIWIMHIYLLDALNTKSVLKIQIYAYFIS